MGRRLGRAVTTPTLTAHKRHDPQPQGINEEKHHLEGNAARLEMVTGPAESKGKPPCPSKGYKAAHAGEAGGKTTESKWRKPRARTEATGTMAETESRASKEAGLPRLSESLGRKNMQGAGGQTGDRGSVVASR